MKICVINADLTGCFQYRVVIPFLEQKKFGVDYVAYPFIPFDSTKNYLELLLNFVYPYDLVIVQRCYDYQIFATMRQACDILGKKLVFETDDDYLNIPITNPAAAEMHKPKNRAGFVEILRMADAITVTTQELKNLYYQFNRNIIVLPNNVEAVHYYKDFHATTSQDTGVFHATSIHGFMHVPHYVKFPDESMGRCIRIGYSGTPSHKADFNTIKSAWFKVIKKHSPCVIYLGDKYFYDVHVDELGPDNVLYFPSSQYFLYYQNIRCLDIGIAPLVPDLFNMSKSPIKAIEYGSWGIPAVLPNYCTYNREFTHGKNTLLYNNKGEFADALSEMITNTKLRETIGHNAREHIKENRLECLPKNCEERFKFMESLVTGSHPIRIFKQGEIDANNQENASEQSAA